MHAMRDNARGRVVSNIRAELARRGRRQAELMAVLGLSSPALQNRMSGRTTFRLHELEAIASWLDVPLEALATFEDFPEAVAVAKRFGIIAATEVAA